MLNFDTHLRLHCLHIQVNLQHRTS